MLYVIKHVYLEQQPFNLAYFISKKKKILKVEKSKSNFFEV